MTWKDRRLLAAMACSLLLHSLLFVPGFQKPPKPAGKMPPLEASLRPPPAPEQPPLMLPEQPKPTKAPPPPKPEKKAIATARGNWTSEVRRQLAKMDKQGQFYPPEAKAQGLQGDAVLLLVLDENGNVVAARIEQGSGHEILDQGALRAVRRLKSLPADAPREAQLSVRFRLQ